MIRAHGDAVEADLAFRGVDLRDLWRPGSGLTLRRLWVLIRALPWDSETKTEYREAAEKALKPRAEQIRDRQEHYARQQALAAESEESA